MQTARQELQLLSGLTLTFDGAKIMAGRKRSTGRLLSLFVLRRAKQLRFNPEVPMAVERFSGKPFAKVWARIKCAVFDEPLKRRKGRK